MCAQSRNDLIVRTRLAVRNTGNDVRTVGLGIRRVVGACGVVHRAEHNSRGHFNSIGKAVETQTVNIEVPAMS